MLGACAGALSAQGVHVPEAGTRHKPGCHNGLLGKIDPRGEPGRPLEPWTLFAREIRHVCANRFVVSAEDLAAPDDRAAAAGRLAELAAQENLDVDIVGYARPQWQLLESEYSQRVKARRIGAPFESFAAGTIAGDESSILDFNQVFAPFRRAFPGSVKVFPLEPSRLPQGLLRHFLTRIGATLEPGATAAFAGVNRRLGAKEIEARRLVREIGGEGTPEGRMLWPAERDRLKRLPDLLKGDQLFAPFGLEHIRSVEALYAPANACFARDYGIDPDGVLFHDAPDVEATRPSIARWRGFSACERCRVRRYVLDRTGVDLGPARGVVARAVARWARPQTLAARVQGLSDAVHGEQRRGCQCRHSDTGSRSRLSMDQE